MCNYYLRFSFCVILFLFSSFLLKSQNEIGSPYSGYGVGILTNRSNGILSQMGGVSYAMQSPYYINCKNPASYSVFDSLSFVADGGFSIFSTKQVTSTMTQKGSFARADYLSIGFPITKRWRTSVGILPYSDLGYDILTTNTVDNIGSVEYSYEGTGGLIQFYWGNAFRICKGLSLGLNVSYLFGNFNTLRFVYFSEDNFFNSRIADIRYLDGINLSGGLQYFVSVKDKHKLGFGIVYENTPFMWSLENLLITNFDNTVYEYETDLDTVAINMGDNALKGKVKMPQILGGGVSYNFDERLILSADVTWQNWKKFSMTNSSDSLKDNFIYALGAQFTKDPNSSSYLNRLCFRVGTRYSTGYIVIRDTPIREFSVSAGLGFPLNSYNFKSTLNVMFEYTHFGTVKSDLIAQNYFRFSFNFTLHEKWYQRVKLD